MSLTDGSATVTVRPRLLPGSYTITADFAGDDHFVAASGSTGLTVTAIATNIDLDWITERTVTYGETTDVTISVNSIANTLAPEGDVVLTWAGWEVGRVTLSSAHDNGSRRAHRRHPCLLRSRRSPRPSSSG